MHGYSERGLLDVDCMAYGVLERDDGSQDGYDDRVWSVQIERGVISTIQHT